MKRKKLRLTPKQAEHMLFNVLEIGSRMLVSGAEVQRVENFDLSYVYCIWIGNDRSLLHDLHARCYNFLQAIWHDHLVETDS